jgi:hypothetical protein
VLKAGKQAGRHRRPAADAGAGWNEGGRGERGDAPVVRMMRNALAVSDRPVNTRPMVRNKIWRCGTWRASMMKKTEAEVRSATRGGGEWRG